LLCVAPYCVPGGIRVVSGARGLRAAVSYARSQNWMLGMPKLLAGKAEISSALRLLPTRFVPARRSH